MDLVKKVEQKNVSLPNAKKPRIAKSPEARAVGHYVALLRDGALILRNHASAGKPISSACFAAVGSAANAVRDAIALLEMQERDLPKA